YSAAQHSNVNGQPTDSPTRSYAPIDAANAACTATKTNSHTSTRHTSDSPPTKCPTPYSPANKSEPPTQTSNARHSTNGSNTDTPIRPTTMNEAKTSTD